MTIAIIIIVILSLAVAFLLWVLRVVLRQNEGTISEKVDNWVESKKQWTTVDMIDFAQANTNYEVTMYDLDEWKAHNKGGEVRFSEN